MRPTLRTLLSVVAVTATAGCLAPIDVVMPPPAVPPPASTLPRLDPDAAARAFVAVVQRVEPIAEAECRARSPQLNCDFQIAVDSRPGIPPNAFQTRDASGRPIIGFTLALIMDARNPDELAFVLGHEAAHHIAGHLDLVQQSAWAGAVAAGVLASLGGARPEAIERAQSIGAGVGARTFSKDFELEADSLGTVIAWRAGYDPITGAGFFSRLPDPGNTFLGSHPPNADRQRVVAQTLAQIRGGT
ncbi:MAG: M48 family metallopeptidase [Rhodobacteraceae bacterium]|jgi:predicted Zn-dependent protease|nr:M48 family metallopeptidase [Paracoccaceae bacterium]